MDQPLFTPQQIQAALAEPEAHQQAHRLLEIPAAQEAAFRCLDLLEAEGVERSRTRWIMIRSEPRSWEEQRGREGLLLLDMEDQPLAFLPTLLN